MQAIDKTGRIIRPEVAEQLASDIQTLAAIERPSASPGELAAARWVQSRLRSMGLAPQVERFQFNPDYWTVWGAHGVLAIAAAWLAIRGRRAVRVASLISLLTVLSFWGELTTRFSLLRRLMPTRTSCNVLARLSDDAEAPVLIVSAHHDAPHSGVVFHPRIPRALPSRLRGFAEPAAVLKAPFGGMLLVALAAVTRAFGARRHVVRRILLFGASINAGFLVLLWNIARSRPSPGANDNASGVAALLALAQRLSSDPPSGLSIWFLSTGCEEGMLGGMRAFLKQHRRELGGRRAWLLNLEVLGSGRPVYLEGEGYLGRRSYQGELLSLARELSQSGLLVNVDPWARPPFVTDALIAAQHGIPALTIASLDRDSRVSHYHWRTDVPENIDLASVETAYTLCHELIQRLAKEASRNADATDETTDGV